MQKDWGGSYASGFNVLDVTLFVVFMMGCGFLKYCLAGSWGLRGGRLCDPPAGRFYCLPREILLSSRSGKIFKFLVSDRLMR